MQIKTASKGKNVHVHLISNYWKLILRIWMDLGFISSLHSWPFKSIHMWSPPFQVSLGTLRQESKSREQSYQASEAGQTKTQASAWTSLCLLNDSRQDRDMAPSLSFLITMGRGIHGSTRLTLKNTVRSKASFRVDLERKKGRQSSKEGSHR